MTKKNILLTGASGTVGFEVLKQFLNKEAYNITVFDVKNSRTEKQFSKLPQNFELVYGDISNERDVEKVTHNKDAVIHLAAIIPPLADDNPALAKKVNVDGTQNLLRALEQHSPKAFFLYSSSISVYGDRNSNPYISVGDELKPSEGDEYAETKIATEQLIKNSKLSWTIFRLSAIMGNHKVSKLMFHMPLDTPMEICTPSDTARAFVHGVEKKDELQFKIFNLSGGESCRISYQDFLKKSFHIFGLGSLNFPNKAFAEKNFHCGYYKDGDELNDILDFRRDNIDDYFAKVKEGVNPVVRQLTKVINPLIKKNLLKSSEPYDAYKENDQKLIARFFK